MKANGFLLREAIRRWELRRDTAINQFEDSLKKFPNEEKPHPTAIAAEFLKCEGAIAKIQAAQARYNLSVEIAVGEEKMSLTEAVKRLGGAGRMEKLWRAAAGAGKKNESHSFYDTDTRDPDKIRAARTISLDDALKEARKASAYASALRAGLAKGNSSEIEANEFLNPELLTE